MSLGDHVWVTATTAFHKTHFRVSQAMCTVPETRYRVSISATIFVLVMYMLSYPTLRIEDKKRTPIIKLCGLRPKHVAVAYRRNPNPSKNAHSGNSRQKSTSAQGNRYSVLAGIGDSSGS